MQPLGPGRDVAEHGGRRRRHERRVVVLAGREDVQPDLLGLQRDGHHRLDPLVLASASGRWSGPVVTSPTVKIPNCMLAHFTSYY